jgi:hypothetical protein
MTANTVPNLSSPNQLQNLDQIIPCSLILYSTKLTTAQVNFLLFVFYIFIKQSDPKSEKNIEARSPAMIVDNY